MLFIASHPPSLFEDCPVNVWKVHAENRESIMDMILECPIADRQQEYKLEKPNFQKYTHSAKGLLASYGIIINRSRHVEVVVKLEKR